jgi:hypothetical protein
VIAGHKLVSADYAEHWKPSHKHGNQDAFATFVSFAAIA